MGLCTRKTSLACRIYAHRQVSCITFWNTSDWSASETLFWRTTQWWPHHQAPLLQILKLPWEVFEGENKHLDRADSVYLPNGFQQSPTPQAFMETKLWLHKNKSPWLNYHLIKGQRTQVAVKGQLTHQGEVTWRALQEDGLCWVCAVQHIYKRSCEGRRNEVEEEGREWIGKVSWWNSVISYQRKVFSVVRVNCLWKASPEDLARVTKQ